MILSIRQRVIDFLTNGDTCTATELHKQLNIDLSSLSSVLKKMTDEGVLDRFDGHGPRGGYGYVLRRL